MFKIQECIDWINEQKSIEIPGPTLEDVTKVLNVINQNGEAKLGWNGELPADVSSLKTRATNLEGRVSALESGKQIEVIEKSGNLDVDAWSNNLQTITVNGVDTTDVVIVGPTYGPDSSAGSYELYGIKPYAQATNTLTFQCANPPTENIALNIILFKHNS
jgi:hypothetical protein